MNKQLTNAIDTPGMLLNIDKLENNIKDIVDFSNEYNVAYRPHIKTHKSINIAKKQIEAGAIGITVATVGEAEIMAEGGIKDILIAFPVAIKEKLDRIEKLLNQSKITVAVDSISQANILNDYFKHRNHILNVWIKVNSGLNRAGVEPNHEVKDLANVIKDSFYLSLDGIFTHAGHSYAAQSETEIKQIAQKEAEVVLESVKICESIGIDIQNRSIGSTPTFKEAGKIEGITEIRPGNAVFFDMIQVGLGVASIEHCALTIVSSVGSIQSNRIVIDAGSKTLNLDKGAHGNENVIGHGYIKEYPQLIIDRLSEEHGIITTDTNNNLQITEKLTIIPNHACTVVNLFDNYLIHRKGEIIDVWKVDARGKVK